MNIKNISLNIALCIGLTCHGLTPDIAKADLEDTLESMLGVNVQVNSGAALSTARRGGIYGGSVYIRGKVMNVDVINFTPPSFASGCGGIDIFGGSFSMINAEQFVALLRSIAQNALGYAFQLALKNICEQCATLVSGLQKAVQAMNEFSGNSCQLAQGVVNEGIKALELSDVKGMQGNTISEGFNDAFEAFWGDLGSSLNALDTPGPGGTSTYEDKYEVNVVWAAMRDSTFSGWFGAGGDNSLMEAFMSLTGTIVLSGRANDDSGNPSRSVVPAVAGGFLTVRDIVYGNDDAKFLDCIDGQKCLNMSTTEQDLKGILEILREEYIGTGPSDNTTILYQIVNGTNTAQASSNKIITELGQVGSMVIALARVSPKGSDAPYTLFEENIEYIAYELARKLLTTAVAQVEQAIRNKNYDTAYAEDWRRSDFQVATQRIGRELDAIGEKQPSPMETMKTFIEVYQYLLLSENPLQ